MLQKNRFLQTSDQWLATERRTCLLTWSNRHLAGIFYKDDNLVVLFSDCTVQCGAVPCRSSRSRVLSAFTTWTPSPTRLPSSSACSHHGIIITSSRYATFLLVSVGIVDVLRNITFFTVTKKRKKVLSWFLQDSWIASYLTIFSL